METGEKHATPSLKSYAPLANIYFTNTGKHPSLSI